MCGASDNRAAQRSLTVTLSRHRERELEGRRNWEPGQRVSALGQFQYSLAYDVVLNFA